MATERTPMQTTEPHANGQLTACKRKHGSPKQVADGWTCNRCGAKLCGARLKSKQARCRSDKVMANGRCRMHGGATPAGIGSPNWKHGLRSKDRWLHHLPAKTLGDRFDAAVADPTLMELRRAVALNDAMLTSYTASLKDTGKPLTLKQQERVHKLIEMQGRLAEREARRLRDLAAGVTDLQFAAYTRTITQLFIEFVPDVQQRKVIARRIDQALLNLNRAETEGGGDEGDG